MKGLKVTAQNTSINVHSNQLPDFRVKMPYLHLYKGENATIVYKIHPLPMPNATAVANIIQEIPK
jgi:hypothetical protein